MRKYFKVYRKTQTSLYGQSCNLVAAPPDAGWELVYCIMPSKLVLLSRFNELGSSAALIMVDHNGVQHTRTGFDLANSMFPCGPYSLHPKD